MHVTNPCKLIQTGSCVQLSTTTAKLLGILSCAGFCVDTDFQLIGQIPRSMIDGSCGKGMFSQKQPNCLPKQLCAPYCIPTIRQRKIPWLHQHLLQHSVLSAFWILPTRVGMQWHLVAVSVCSSLVPHDTEHPFICFFATCVSRLVWCLLRLFVAVLLGF